MARKFKHDEIEQIKEIAREVAMELVNGSAKKPQSSKKKVEEDK